MTLCNSAGGLRLGVDLGREDRDRLGGTRLAGTRPAASQLEAAQTIHTAAEAAAAHPALVAGAPEPLPVGEAGAVEGATSACGMTW